jgi:hypothetical protein
MWKQYINETALMSFLWAMAVFFLRLFGKSKEVTIRFLIVEGLWRWLVCWNVSVWSLALYPENPLISSAATASTAVFFTLFRLLAEKACNYIKTNDFKTICNDAVDWKGKLK